MVSLCPLELYEVSEESRISFLAYNNIFFRMVRPDQLWILNPKKILKRLDIATSLELTSRNAEDATPKIPGIHFLNFSCNYIRSCIAFRIR
jgi:hypothetical protein